MGSERLTYGELIAALQALPPEDLHRKVEIDTCDDDGMRHSATGVIVRKEPDFDGYAVVITTY